MKVYNCERYDLTPDTQPLGEAETGVEASRMINKARFQSGLPFAVATLHQGLDAYFVLEQPKS